MKDYRSPEIIFQSFNSLDVIALSVISAGDGDNWDVGAQLLI